MSLQVLFHKKIYSKKNKAIYLFYTFVLNCFIECKWAVTIKQITNRSLKSITPKGYLGTLSELFFFCLFVQRSLEERTQTIEGVELRVFGVERTINSHVDLPTTWQSYFMNDG